MKPHNKTDENDQVARLICALGALTPPVGSSLPAQTKTKPELSFAQIDYLALQQEMYQKLRFLERDAELEKTRKNLLKKAQACLNLLK